MESRSSDLARSATFYDAVFFAIGVRRMHVGEHAIAYGVTGPTFWIATRGRPPAPGYGHVAFRAAGRVAVDHAYELVSQPAGAVMASRG